MDSIVDIFNGSSTEKNQIPVFLLISISELIQIVANSTLTYDQNAFLAEKGVISNCSMKFVESGNASYAVMGYNVICLIIFSMMVRRVSFQRDQCHGRPGLVLPMNMLNSHDFTIEYTLVFLSLSEDIYNSIFEQNALFGPSLPIINFFVKLLLVFCFSIFSYPEFAAVTSRCLIGYSLMLASSIANVAIRVLTTYSRSFCVVGTKLIPHLLIQIVYVSIDIAVVCLFFWKTVSHLLRNGCRNRELHDFQISSRKCSEFYVKELFKIKETIENSNSNENIDTEKSKTIKGIKFLINNCKCDDMKSKLRRKMFLQIPGFTIPPRLIIGIAVGLYFAYRIFLDTIRELTPVTWNLINNINNIYPSLNVTLQRAFMLVWANYSNYQTKEIQNAYRYLTLFYTHLLIGCLLCAIFIGFVNSIIQSFLVLRNYRLQFHKIARKGFGSFIQTKTAPPPNVLVLWFVQFSGYQAAFTLWGILVVIVFTFLVLFPLIGMFFLPLFFVENSWARKIVINYGPVLIATIIFNIIQSLIVKHVFVKEKGTLMEIDNRRAFMIYTHCAFFLNAMMGIFNSIKRVIIWLFMAAFCFQRIDFSSLPDYLKGCDSGYMCYVGFMFTEQHHFNPILQCFTKLLYDKRNFEYILMEKAEKEKKRIRYRNLWHLSLSLINNKQLFLERRR